MVEHEQERPLASEAHQISIPNDTVTQRSTEEETERKRLRRRCVQCCGCTSAVLVILGVTLLILFLTVFKVKDPKINLNNVTIRGLEGVDPRNLVPSTNLTLIAEVSVKNPNIASFKYKNATTEIYYENVLIGEAQIPKGNAKARKTIQMTVTANFLLEKIIRVSRLPADLTAGTLALDTKTSIRGRVEIIEIVKKTVGVKLDCTSTVVIADQTVRDQKCTKSVKF